MYQYEEQNFGTQPLIIYINIHIDNKQTKAPKASKKSKKAIKKARKARKAQRKAEQRAQAQN